MMLKFDTSMRPLKVDVVYRDDEKIVFLWTFDTYQVELYRFFGKYPSLMTASAWAEFIAQEVGLSDMDRSLLEKDIDMVTVDDWWFNELKNCGISETLLAEFKLWIGLLSEDIRINIYTEYVLQTDSIRAYYDICTDTTTSRYNWDLSPNETIFFRKLIKEKSS